MSTPSTLWTRDFTIITLGSVVSMVGSTLSGFAMSIMVLDYTGSTLLYAIFNIGFQLPVLVVPLLAGPYLDRMSRKKVIYRLDFLSATLYLLMFLLMSQGWFNYVLLLAFCLITGAINSVYSVAYDSFYPNLITEGNFSKAYSISSLLWPLAAMTSPIAALIYDRMGTILPLLALDGVSFFIAACFERTIRYQETHMDKAAPVQSQNPLRQFGVDFKEGMSYILSEKGLLAVTLYFTVSNFAGSGGGTLHLPFFRSHAYLYIMWPVAAVTLYAIVSNAAVIGRLIGGLIHYKVHFPTHLKFRIAPSLSWPWPFSSPGCWGSPATTSALPPPSPMCRTRNGPGSTAPSRCCAPWAAWRAPSWPERWPRAWTSATSSSCWRRWTWRPSCCLW